MIRQLDGLLCGRDFADRSDDGLARIEHPPEPLARENHSSLEKADVCDLCRENRLDRDVDRLGHGFSAAGKNASLSETRRFARDTFEPCGLKLVVNQYEDVRKEDADLIAQGVETLADRANFPGKDDDADPRRGQVEAA
jgi:hypothetical protein